MQTKYMISSWLINERVMKELVDTLCPTVQLRTSVTCDKITEPKYKTCCTSY